MPTLRSTVLYTVLFASAASAQTSVPSGFIVEDVVSGQGLTLASGLAFLPDGRLLVVELTTGNIRVVANGLVGNAGQVAGVSVGVDRGLTGIAADPGWPVRPYIS